MNVTTRRSLTGLCVATLLCWLPQPAPVSAFQSEAIPSEDVRIVAGLRARRLFDLASLHCQARLQDLAGTGGNDSENERVELTLEWMKNLTAQATYSEADQRDATWQSALQVADEFVRQHPSHPKKILVEVQRALVNQARGRVLRQEIDADIAGPQARELALRELQTASVGFEKLEQEIDRLIPLQRRRTVGPNELSAKELKALKDNLRFQSAIANLNRAQLFPPTDNLNRMDALNQVNGRLNEVERVCNPEDNIWWQVQFEKATCMRLLGTPKDAVEILLKLPFDEATEAQKQSILEQLILTSIELNTPNTELLLQQANEIEQRTQKLDLAVMQLLKFKSTTSRSDQDKNRWLGLAEKQTRRIEQQHGAYWGRRAELILIGRTGESRGESTPAVNSNTTQLAILERVGDQAVRKERHADAVKAFDQAINVAREKANWKAYFLLGVKAAKSEEALKRHGDASKRMIELAKEQPKSEFASATHLRGCWNLFQTLKGKDKQAFIVALRENLETWPDSKTSDQARTWLAGQYQAQKKWEQALATYFQIRRAQPLGSSLRQATYCATQLGKEANARDRVSRFIELAQKKIELYQKLTPGPEAAAIAETVRKLDLFQAEIGLPSSLVNAGDVASRLSNAFADVSEQDKVRFAAWTIAAIGLAPDSNLDVQVWVNNVSKQTADLKLTANVLQTVSDNRSGRHRKLEQARLSIIDELLKRLPAQASERSNWISQKALTLIKLGRDQEAVTELKEMVSRNPNNAGSQLALARTLTRLGTQQADREALTQWRRVASRLKSNSENWFEAKYHVAMLLKKSGDREAAQKLLRFIKAIPPGWSKSQWKSQFDQLWKELS